VSLDNSRKRVRIATTDDERRSKTMHDDARRRETMGDGRLVRRDHRVNVTDGKGRWQTMKDDDGRWETRTDDVVAALGITGDRDTGIPSAVAAGTTRPPG
jgi:hypothetical protein